MQFLKVDDISIDRLTEKEYEEIRRRHADASYNIILKRVQPYLTRDDFHLPNIDEEYLPVIARVAKGHSTDYFESVVSEFQSDPATPKGRKVRGELLTALLMIADELDLQTKRVDFNDLSKFNPSTYSLTHWFKHHYVDYVAIESGIVRITLRFPESAKTYPEVIREQLKAKLNKQIERVNPIMSRSTGGLLHLESTIQFDEKVDKTGLKRSAPDDVIKELQTMPKTSEAETSARLYCAVFPKPSPIFTGRKDEIEKFKKVFYPASFISVEGLGGIGKTEFAAKCIEEFAPRGRVVWFDCVPDSKLDLLIDCSGYPDVLKGESKTELAKYSGFTDLIERDRKTIFLDNFQDVIDPSFKAFFKFAERRLSRARIVLLSREMPDAGVRVAPVPLEGLQEDSLEYARRLIETYYNDVAVNDVKLDGEDITETLHRLYDKKMITRSRSGNLYSTHPLIREFCYQRLQNKSEIHLKAAEYLQTLRRETFNSTLEEKIFHHLYSGGNYDKAADLITEKGESFILSGYTNTLRDLITSTVDRLDIKRAACFETFSKVI
ncbi:MAG TPA: hypothetical protein VFG09_03340 [Thermodesulfovibrionales bacterium]|nr:hypothetical protein [Thermodesulfovibrionales bacterium]